MKIKKKNQRNKLIKKVSMSHKAAHSHGRRRRKLGSKKRRSRKLRK